MRKNLYDQTDYFNFPIVNIPSASAYGVFQNLWLLSGFLALIRKPLNQGFLVVILTWFKPYGIAVKDDHG